MRLACGTGLAGALMLALFSAPVLADGLYAPPSGWRADYCFLIRRSPILELSSVDEMRGAVEERYDNAVDVSLQPSSISSRSPRFAWAQEAKLACGKAIGYFKGREVNEDMISKCDCYHGRMLSHMRW